MDKHGFREMDKHGFREIQKKLRLTNRGVSEAMDVELFTVQNWASGVWPIPNAMAKFLRTLVVLSKKVDTLDTYMKGHTTGFSEGYSRGSNDGYAAGKQKGYEYGFKDKHLSVAEAYRRGYQVGGKEDHDDQRTRHGIYMEGYRDAMRAARLF